MENSLESQIIDALGAYSFIFTNSPLEQSRYIKLAEKYNVETAVEELFADAVAFELID
tara:strand:+ start:10971 stop:11144 length:174 start_codon:yes stop_codon:yes gene_type:complete